jgi:two-component system chemotaxis response regulator CheY
VPPLRWSPNGERPSVLIVDDDPVVRLLVARITRTAGLAIGGQAGNGREAIRLAALVQPDIVILDLTMPVVGGDAALPKLRGILPHAKIVVLSARTNQMIRDDMLDNGADVFVDKAEATTALRDVLAHLGAVAAAAPR